MIDELKQFNDYKDTLTNYVEELRKRSDESMLNVFSEMRGIPLEEVKSSGIFYIKDATEMLLPTYIDVVERLGVISPTNKKPIYHNRYIIPIKDVDSKVINLVGYSKDADERYVYGTSEYYRRRETMYGLENLHLAYKLGYAILTEGITDTIRVRSLGDKYRVSFANCGTHGSDFIMKQLNRCRFGIIKIPDRDEAGKRALGKWKAYRSVTINTFIQYKDIDAMCKDSDDNIELVKLYIDNSIEWLKTMEHNGRYCASEELTIGS